MTIGTSRRWILWASVLLAVFLVGLIPMWNTARARTRERDAAQSALRVSQMQITLANAAIDARRGEYERARQAASAFFTELGAEFDRGQDSPFTRAQQDALRPLLAGRDDMITLLARADPASADRLLELYVAYRQQRDSAPPR
jgi:hypothetical protein